MEKNEIATEVREIEFGVKVLSGGILAEAKKRKVMARDGFMSRLNYETIFGEVVV